MNGLDMKSRPSVALLSQEEVEFIDDQSENVSWLRKIGIKIILAFTVSQLNVQANDQLRHGRLPFEEAQSKLRDTTVTQVVLEIVLSCSPRNEK